jgi:hypothetical protein
MVKKIDPDDYLLDPENDAMLIRGINKYAEIAGIGGNPEYIWMSGKKNPDVDNKDDREVINKLFKLKEENHFGVAYLGFDSSLLSRKFMALTGMLLRKYKDAFYSPMSMYVVRLMDSGNPGHEVTFIPDFISEGHSEKVPEWKQDIVLGLLMEKQASGEILVVGISDIDVLRKVYGVGIYNFIIGNYTSVHARASK